MPAETRDGEALKDAVIAAERDKVLVKQKLAFNADWCGPRASLRKDVRTVTLLYADGTRFVVKLIDEEGGHSYVTVNGVTVAALDMSPADLFRALTLTSPARLDGDLQYRMSYGARRSVGAVSVG